MALRPTLSRGLPFSSKNYCSEIVIVEGGRIVNDVGHASFTELSQALELLDLYRIYCSGKPSMFVLTSYDKNNDHKIRDVRDF